MITFIAVIVVLASISIVSWPLLKGIGRGNGLRLVEDTEVSEALAQKDATLFAISELESDRETGSLSQSDYQELRQKYEEKAMALIKTLDELQGELGPGGVSSLDDEIEARVSEMRSTRTTDQDIEDRVRHLRGQRDRRIAATGKSCPSCGAPIQPDATFCSSCGADLSARCPNCSGTISTDDRFCPRCGAALNAKCPGCSAEVGSDDQFCSRCGAELNVGGNT